MDISVNTDMANKIGTSGSKPSNNNPPSLGSDEDGVAPARDYGCGKIEGKSDTGTFGGSWNRGSQGMGK